MMYKVVEMTKEIEKNPALALKKSADAVAVHVNAKIFKKMSSAALKQASTKKGKKTTVDLNKLVTIKANPIVHNGNYVLVELWEPNGMIV